MLWFVDFYSLYQSWFTTLILSALPLTELRGSIPIGLGYFKLSIPAVLSASIIGNLLPAFFLIFFLEPISKWLSEKSSLAKKFFTWWFEKATKKFRDRYGRYGFWALMIFVAIPLPTTGAWTGSVAAFLFGIPKKKALLAISLGVIIASFLVTAIFYGLFSLI